MKPKNIWQISGNSPGEKSFSKKWPEDISKNYPGAGNFHETRQAFTFAHKYEYTTLSFKFYLWLNFCVPFKATIRNSPCGRCWQRRVAQWHLRLHCFSGPGKEWLYSFTLNRRCLKSHYSLNNSSQPIRLIIAILPYAGRYRTLHQRTWLDMFQS